MWPYDYFNQHSALLNEFDVDIEYPNGYKEDNQRCLQRNVFIAMSFGRADCRIKEIYEHFYRPTIENREFTYANEQYKLVITNDKSGGISDFLRYKLRTVLGKIEHGDINFEILGRIIEATLIMCDVTPENKDDLKPDESRKERDNLPIFNSNVMAELGIALAWKTPEQVIIISDKIDKYSIYKSLPFAIKGYFVNEIDFSGGDKEGKLVKIVHDRLKQIDIKKKIIIKNIKSKLDRSSLDILANNKGLPFSLEKERCYVKAGEGCISLATGHQISIGRLIESGLIKTEIFPQKEDKTSNDSAYYFTELGRYFLIKGLDVKELHPTILADLLLVRYWKGYQEGPINCYKRQQDNFKNKYNDISWENARNLLSEQIPKEHYINEKDGELDITATFNKATTNKKFDNVMSEIVNPWLKKLKEIKK